MKNYYIIHPSPDGLTATCIGKVQDFDMACEAADEWAKAYPDMPAVWISDEKDLVNLFRSIKKLGF